MKKISKFFCFALLLSSLGNLTAVQADAAGVETGDRWIGGYLDYSPYDGLLAYSPLVRRNDDKFSLSEGENGAAILTSDKLCTDHVIVITDGTEIQEYSFEHGDDIGNSRLPFGEVHEIGYDYAMMMGFWDSETYDRVATYGENVRFYQFDYSDCKINYVNMTSDPNLLNRECRKLSMQDGVLEVIPYTEQVVFETEWNGHQLGPLRQKLTDEEWDAINKVYEEENIEEKENEILAKSEQYYAEYQEKLAAWTATEYNADMTEQEKYESKKQAGVPTNYECMKAAYEFAEELYSVSEIRYNHWQPSYSSFRNAKLTLFGETIWDGIGDTNGDAEIDSSDASMILEYAAQAGTSAVTDSSVNAVMADVNADGVVNALDASLVLAYSAQKGAGENISLHDICRNK